MPGRLTLAVAAAALATVLASLACGSGRVRPRGLPLPPPPQAPSLTSLRLVRADGLVETLDLERYVRGVVEAESWVQRDVPPAVAERMFAVQALIARTYAAANSGRHKAEGADLCTTTHCQVYRPPAASFGRATELDAALANTAGRLVVYEGRPILALFHSSCGGATSAPETVWGGESRPYLRSVADPFCARVAQPWHARLDRPALVRALDADPRTQVGGRLDAIEVRSRDAGDRAALVALIGSLSPVVRGTELRAVLSRAFGAYAVRSTRFRVSRDGDAFVFEGTGFGHGAGLCQAGALTLLRGGSGVREVLAHYYPGAAIDGPLLSDTDD